VRLHRQPPLTKSAKTYHDGEDNVGSKVGGHELGEQANTNGKSSELESEHFEFSVSRTGAIIAPVSSVTGECRCSPAGAVPKVTTDLFPR
jgi:hypothetical protein